MLLNIGAKGIIHAQYNPDERFYQFYVDKGLSKEEAMYASLLQGMDKSWADLMNYLEANNLANNTIVIFMSDNGGLSLVPPRAGKVFTHNLSLKASKGSTYEGGIREPIMMHWPRFTKPNTTNSQYVIIEDFFPTILQMAGVNKIKTVQQIDGKSIVPFFNRRQ